MDNVDDARDELEKILNETEYTTYSDQPSSLFSIWLEKAKNWIADQLDQLFPAIKTTGILAGPILTIVIVMILLLMGTVLFFVVRNRSSKRKFRETSPLQSTKEIDWSYQMHVTEAMKQEGLEKLSSATRHLFLALLLYFHEKEWLEARIWKTNWEYYEELKKVNQQSANQFQHLSYFFDEATYGEREVQKEDYVQFQKEVMKYLGGTDE
ncbi:DUF4129 domain-containing protein [Sporosarcina sp. E16_8]|uniref:DUF4129 domain-containing protein n=1 Tax=Sporosarcina sp. E16_8 TaxID=2789295 RepID=UPI001A930512|nr:DUF4129 domain-containing protein [Sporosarcina sp. E16_8]MBO0586747.1 DUF4129 domain-containing protein [Sporosarcina sp. E16_8]